MTYNLDNLWQRVDTAWSGLEAKALVAIAIELRALRRMLQPEPSRPVSPQTENATAGTKTGGSA